MGVIVSDTIDREIKNITRELKIADIVVCLHMLVQTVIVLCQINLPINELKSTISWPLPILDNN